MSKILMVTLTLLMAVFVPPSPPPQPLKFMRDPHIANGMIVFSYQGDIWMTNAEGLNPHRLTAHPANDWSPRFSPDGQQVAFSSDRTGNNDVFVVPGRWDGRHAKFDFPRLAELEFNLAVLGLSPLCDVKAGHDLEARHDGAPIALRDLHIFETITVDAEPHEGFSFFSVRLDMNV